MAEWRNIRGLWPGALALLSSLAGTLLIRSEGTRLLGVLWLLAGAVLAVLAWRDQQWGPAFGGSGVGGRGSGLGRKRGLAIVGIALAAIFVLAANLAYAGSPGEAFGLAGWLWLGGISLLLVSAYMWDRATTEGAENLTKVSQSWARWEIAAFAGIVLLSFVLRAWDLKSFPYNIYPDEIMTGQVANGAYLSAQPPPPLFSTLWGGIDLPALWFFIVSRFQIAGGSTLEMLRLPGALFGAATVVPFYLMVRGVWGRWAAIGGAAVLAASASNINYSRLGAQQYRRAFFWTLCFFFLLRAIRERRALDWALAGLSAGLSEHFYNGTRLLPLILAAFLAYLLLFHWRQARGLIGAWALAALGFLAGFGPLLAHFLRNPSLYFGRGTELLTWKEGVPTSLDELGRNVGHALSDCRGQSARLQHNTIAGHHVLRAPAPRAGGRTPRIGVRPYGLEVEAPGGFPDATFGFRSTFRGRHACELSECLLPAIEPLDPCLPRDLRRHSRGSRGIRNFS